MQKISEKTKLQGIPIKTKSEIKFEAEADLRRYKECDGIAAKADRTKIFWEG